MTKISPVDWIMALKYSSMYAKDYEEYLKEYNKAYEKSRPGFIEAIKVLPSLPETKKKTSVVILSEASRKLCQKYKLRYPIDVGTPFHKSDLLKVRSPIDYFNPREFMQNSYMAPVNSTVHHKDLMSYIGDKIVIMIDPMFSKDQIRAEFEKILDDRFTNSKERVKVNKVDIWEVYRMCHLEGKNFNQVAIEKLQSGGGPSTDLEDDRKFQLIKRAYAKAARIIATIEKLARENQ